MSELGGAVRVPKVLLLVIGVGLAGLLVQGTIYVGGLYALGASQCSVNNTDACELDVNSDAYDAGYEAGYNYSDSFDAEAVENACAAAAEEVFGLNEDGGNAYVGCLDGWMDGQ